MFKNFRFTFDPQKKGLRKILGDLETDIMEIVWLFGDVTVRDVYEEMRKSRKIAYTSVMTVMKRLADKGILSKVKQGQGFLYHPIYSESEFIAAASKRIFNEVIGDFGMPAMSHLLDAVDDEDPAVMEELAMIIAEKRKTKK